MRIVFFISLIICLLFSCRFKEERTVNCRYTSDNLLRDVDSALVVRNDYSKEHFFEIIDKGSNTGARGIYKFDEHKTLRFYAFLLSDSNDYIFSRQYDSLGSNIESTGKEVVQWYFRKISTDSVKITFYLYAVNQIYNDISLDFGDDRIKIELFKSPVFSNLFGGSFTTILDKKRNKVIHIRGEKLSTCLGNKYAFVDSTKVPLEVM